MLDSAARKRRVLIVDDDPFVERAIVQALGADFEAKAIDSGLDLPMALEEFNPDLIILDVGLPWINGFDLCRDLRQTLRGRRIPILFLSGLASAEDAARGLAAGGDRYMANPFDVLDLCRSVQSLLDAAAFKTRSAA